MVSRLIESIYSTLFFICSRNIKNIKNNRYICYNCNTIIDKGKELYFALDMVYCSKECRYKYFHDHDHDYDIV